MGEDYEYRDSLSNERRSISRGDKRDVEKVGVFYGGVRDRRTDKFCLKMP